MRSTRTLSPVLARGRVVWVLVEAFIVVAFIVLAGALASQVGAADLPPAWSAETEVRVLGPDGTPVNPNVEATAGQIWMSGSMYRARPSGATAGSR